MFCESLWLRPLRGSSCRVSLRCFANYEHFFDSFEQYGYHLPDKITVKWQPVGVFLKQIFFEDEADRNPEFLRKLAERMRSGEAVPPVLLDEWGWIFDGRHRVVAAHMLGIRNVPVVQISTLSRPVSRKQALRPLPVPKETAWDIIMRGRR